MQDQILKDELKHACLQVAERVMWTSEGTANDVSELMAEKLEVVAGAFLEDLKLIGRDPRIVIKAIYYLAEAHAIPPMRTEVLWFKEMLQCLVELAAPTTNLTVDGAEFLSDVEAGIAESLQRAGR